MALDDDMLGDYDILGALDDEMLGGLSNVTPEILGAVARRRGAMPQRRLTAGQAALRQRFAFKAPGVPTAGARRMPLGFGSFTFVNAGVTVFSFIALPQVPFKGRRLLIDIVRTGAAAIAVRVDDIQVGTRSQMAGLLAISANAFVPTAFDVDLGLDQCTPGTQIAINVSLSAGPAVGDNITVTPTLIGDALQ